MFFIDVGAAKAIRRAFYKKGETAVVTEFCRHFPLITDDVKGREIMRIIAAGSAAPSGNVR